MRDLEYFERRLMETLAELNAMTKERDELKIENELLKQHGRAWREQAEKLAAALQQYGPVGYAEKALANYAAFKKERGEL